MKKILLTSLLALSAVILTHCRNNEEPTAVQKYTDGVIILNEGNFSQANGNLTFYKSNSGEITPDVIKAENNGTGINATIQRTFDDQVNQKLYVVTNAPDQLLIFNGKTFKNEGVLSTGFTNPYSVAVASGKAFVSEWGTTNFVTYPNAKIQIVDVATRQISASITVGNEVNGMLELNTKIYAAVTGANEVWVINSNNNTIERKIPTANKPSTMEVDANGKLWVLCSSGNLVRINPTNNQVETTISSVSVLGYGEKLVTDATRQNLYWISGTGIFRMNITATTAPTTPLIAGDKFYGVGVNSSTNQIIAGVTNFTSIQEVHFYNISGTFGTKIAANGFLPNGFLFR